MLIEEHTPDAALPRPPLVVIGGHQRPDDVQGQDRHGLKAAVGRSLGGAMPYTQVQHKASESGVKLYAQAPSTDNAGAAWRDWVLW